MKQINQNTAIELKEWIMETPSSNLLAMDASEIQFLLEELTPYKRQPWDNKEMMLQLIDQWLRHEETWEIYPITRKEMFVEYKNLTGKFPKLSVPTLTLFNHFIEIGVLH